MRRLTIVIPVLNEATIIAGALQALAPLRARGAEVIVADGGSRDATAQLALSLADRVITVPQGRGAPPIQPPPIVPLQKKGTDAPIPSKSTAPTPDAIRRANQAAGGPGGIPRI